MVRRSGLILPAQRGRVRRKTSWGIGPGGVVTTALAATGSVLVGSAAAAALDGMTLVRTRGELSLYLTVAGTNLDSFQGAFGIGVVTTQAFAAGVGSVPTPIDEEDEELWIYHTYFALVAPDVTDFASGCISCAVRFTVDSKAMRKLDIGDTVYAVLQATEVGAASMQCDFNSRLLVKLA